MPTQTEEQRKLALQAAGLNPTQQQGVNLGIGYSAPSAISSETLSSNQTPINYQQPQEVPIYNPAGLNSEMPELTATPQEQQQSELTRAIMSLNEQNTGQSTFRAQQENAQGIPDLAKTQNDLSARLKALQNEALAIPLQLQQDATGRGITAGGLQPHQTAALRNNAIQALGVSSLLEASRGNLTLAMDLVDRAVAQKFQPIQEQLDAKIKNLQLIIDDPATKLADLNRANKQKQIQEDRANAIAKQEADAKEVYNIGLTALKYGADLETVQRIQSAKTPQDAIAMGAKFLQDPMAKYELESARLDNILKEEELKMTPLKRQLLSEQIATERTQRAQIGQPTATETKAALEAEALAKDAIPIAQDKLNLIDSLLASPGLKGSVGAYGIARFTPFSADKAARQEFAAGVNQLVNKETIDTLINLKARGGTLGALSDQERILLQSAATKIGSWMQKDKNNNPTGKFEVSEAAFKAELQNIRTLTQRAYDKAAGSVISTADKAVLNAMWSGVSASTPAFINPADYFNQ